MFSVFYFTKNHTFIFMDIWLYNCYTLTYEVKKYTNIAVFIKLSPNFRYVSKKMENVANV